MNYIASINAYENLSAPENTSGVMVTGESIAETNTQRLLMQSLLLLEPETPNDPRLKQLQECQTASWLKKLRNNSQKQLCVRLPDGPIETLLPSLASDFDQLSEFMGCTEEWLRARVKAVWDKHPDLSYYMIISNEMLFESMLCGLFDAAQTCGIEKMSILLPLVNRCREAQQQHLFIAQRAIDYDILCDVGIEIATPRAIYFAGDLAKFTDVIVFQVDELCWLLYGKAQNNGRNQYGFHETPFNEFDDIGIGTLLGVAITQIRRSNPDVRICASGKYVLTEKGLQFCKELGINSVIASPQIYSNTTKPDKKEEFH